MPLKKRPRALEPEAEEAATVAASAPAEAAEEAETAEADAAEADAKADAERMIICDNCGAQRPESMMKETRSQFLVRCFG